MRTKTAREGGGEREGPTESIPVSPTVQHSIVTSVKIVGVFLIS